jgi:hypothetical protein
MPDKRWNQQVLVPSILWAFSMIFLLAAFGPASPYLLCLTCAVWAAMDCANLPPERSRVLGLAFKPVVVFGVCAFFLWGFGFLWYLVMRYRVKRACAETIPITSAAPSA